MLWNSRGHEKGQGQGHWAARWDLGPRCAGLWSEGLAGLQVGGGGGGGGRGGGSGTDPQAVGWGTPGVTGVEAERKDPGLPHGVPVQWVSAKPKATPVLARKESLGLGHAHTRTGTWSPGPGSREVPRAPQDRQWGGSEGQVSGCWVLAWVPVTIA